MSDRAALFVDEGRMPGYARRERLGGRLVAALLYLWHALLDLMLRRHIATPRARSGSAVLPWRDRRPDPFLATLPRLSDGWLAEHAGQASKQGHPL